MAYILIDGYNLIGIAHGNLEKARNELIKDLQKYASLKKHSITIVFDGWKSGLKNQTRTSSRHVTVIYSRLGEKADNVIKRMISSPNTRPWIVVSSDREISDYAAVKDFASVSSAEFEDRMFLSLNMIKSDSLPIQENTSEFFAYDDEDMYSPPTPRKGNPRRMSKKEKKKQQALNKL